MDTKQMTLRSQTKKCPYCGESYSVTYKFCPFCDAAREEAERQEAEKKAEKKTKKQAFLGSLFGGSDSGKKKKSSDGAKKKSASAGNKKPASRSVAFDQDAPETARRTGPRKKMSEMSEAERAAYIAEREARAAQRKRDRERAARMAEANGQEGTTLFDQDAPDRPRPAPKPEAPAEESAVIELHPEAEAPRTEAAVRPEGESESPMETQIINLSLHRPGVKVEPAEAAQPTEPAQPAETVQTEPPAPVDPDAPMPEVKVWQSRPAVEPEVKPAQPAPEEKPVATEEDLDALLSELRNILEDSPVPTLTSEEIKRSGKPAPDAAPAPTPGAEPETPPMAAPVVQTESDRLSQEGPDLLVPEAKVKPAPAPTVRPSGSWIETKEPAPQPEPEPVPEPVVESPAETPESAAPTGQWIDAGEAQPAAVEEAPVKEAEAEPDLLLPVAPRPAPKAKEEEAKKSGGGPGTKKIVLLIISLAIIAAAIFIVARTVVPAFQDGIFSSQKEDEGDNQDEEGNVSSGGAEAISLNKDDASYSEQGATFLLEATFAPEGTTSAIIWTSSDPSVATVDETGLVTTVGPGTATITATIENGATAECTVRCNWTDNTPQPSSGPALSATDLTLDSQGTTRELQVIGAEGTVTWSSANTNVATVNSQGIVTAVDKGRTTITAKVGDETLTCEIRCIW